MSDEDQMARRHPLRKGQFQPGQSGNPRGRPKGSKNLRTYLREELVAKITVIEQGKARKISKAQAIAIQLVNKASVGDPKGLAAVVALTREYDETLPDERLNVLQRAEDTVVIEGILSRIRRERPPENPEPGARLADGGAPQGPESDSNDAATNPMSDP